MDIYQTPTMENTIDRLRVEWHTRLLLTYPHQAPSVQISILNWLLGPEHPHGKTLLDRDLVIASDRVEARFDLLQHRYLNFTTAQRYQHLMERLGTYIVRSTEIELPTSNHRARTETIVNLIEKVLDRISKTDPYIQARIRWIGCCTNDLELRKALLSIDLELYCCQPTGSRSLIVDRCLDYLQPDRALVSPSASRSSCGKN